MIFNFWFSSNSFFALGGGLFSKGMKTETKNSRVIKSQEDMENKMESVPEYHLRHDWGEAQM